MSYQYDAFFSYKRDPQSDRWHEIVKEKLKFWLGMELNRPSDSITIFFDTEEIRTGARWQTKLSDALKRSKCIACVWSLYYFQSRWCVSEWRTFRDREQLFNRELVLPASFHDGKHFPPEARDSKFLDFSDYTSTIPSSLWNSELALEFENKRLKVFARDLASLINNAPPFQDDFPVTEATDEHIIQEEEIGRIANF